MGAALVAQDGVPCRLFGPVNALVSGKSEPPILIFFNAGNARLKAPLISRLVDRLESSVWRGISREVPRKRFSNGINQPQIENATEASLSGR